MIGNWGTLIAFGAASCVVMHLAAWYWRPAPRFANIMAYLSIVAGAISLIPSTIQSNSQFARWTVEGLQPELAAQRELVVEQTKWAREYFCGFKPVRSADSPPDFDKLVASLQAGCTQLRSFHPETVPRSEPMDLTRFGHYPFTIRTHAENVKSIVQFGREANATLKRIKQIEPLSTPAPIEVLMALIGPYVAVFAVALALSAIAPEILPKRAAAPTRWRRARARLLRARSRIPQKSS